MIETIVILAVLVILALILIGIYNRLVSLRQTVRQGEADIDAQLRQRHDLIPNLVSTVKGYAKHESQVFDDVIAARNKADNLRGVDPKAEAQLGGAIARVFALAEAYPDLKANANFQALQAELAEVEDKLAAARRALNAAAARYNAGRESFPAVLFAGALGFAPSEFQRIGEHEREVAATPRVEF